MIVGPLLARFGKGFIPRPGGDKIGRRRLDTHFIGFQKLGAQFVYDSKENFYRVTTDGLKGTYMLLDEDCNRCDCDDCRDGKWSHNTSTCEPYLNYVRC